MSVNFRGDSAGGHVIVPDFDPDDTGQSWPGAGDLVRLQDRTEAMQRHNAVTLVLGVVSAMGSARMSDMVVHVDRHENTIREALLRCVARGWLTRTDDARGALWRWVEA